MAQQAQSYNSFLQLIFFMQKDNKKNTQGQSYMLGCGGGGGGCHGPSKIFENILDYIDIFNILIISLQK